MLTLMASPAQAAPTGPAAPGAPAAGMVPDGGSLPVASAPLTLPGTTPGTTAAVRPPAIGSQAARIMAEQKAVEQLGEQLKQYDIDVTEAQSTLQATLLAWQAAQLSLAAAQTAADQAAANAYKSATELGPLGPYAPDLHDLDRLAPGLEGQVATPGGGQQTGRDLLTAQQQEAAARVAHDAAATAAQTAVRRRDTAQASYTTRSAALAQAQRRNAPQLQTAQNAIDRYEQSLGAGVGAGSAVAGSSASAQALGAVRFALSQLGKPYVWGAEGPDSYDCSGLVLASYRHVGVPVPRVANEQYHATTPVAVDQLLPGDLVFFATNRNDWRTIHHVGIYVGDGKMVHAPHTGDVVRVSPVWWSEFFGATRVVGAVSSRPGGTTGRGTGPDGSAGGGTPAPGGTPTPTPTPSTSPTPGGTTPTPTPTPSDSGTPTPTPSDSGTPTPTPSDSGTPTPTPSDSSSAPPTTDPAPSTSDTTSAPATSDTSSAPASTDTTSAPATSSSTTSSTTDPSTATSSDTASATASTASTN